MTKNKNTLKKLLFSIHYGIKCLLLLFLKFYKKCISPFLPCACRYTPTCSEYMMEAIEKYGILKGGLLGIKRLLRCSPWGGSGYDPVPSLNKKDNKDTN
ncbi:MAG: membrane protein insertion efficiency factor YidD [Alphaproteobacteria bacterium]|nr:membrane protein insertion efficiency factor YidD [Alphaproteobacteria bacterium]